MLTIGLTVLAGQRGAADGAAVASAASTASHTASAVVAVLAGLALLLGFVLLEARLSAKAMMPLALFGTNSFVGVTLLTLFLYAALGGVFMLLPYLLIESGGYSAAAAGAALLPVPIVPCIVAAGFALLLRSGPGPIDYLSVVLPALTVLACGLTLSAAPLTAAVMGAVDAAHVGSASGVNNATARIAGLLATALLGLVLAGGSKGAPFVAGFHAAAVAGALLSLAAAASAWALVADARAGRRDDAPT